MKDFLRKHERIIKTFFEGLFSYVALNVATTDFSSKTAIEGLIAGAVASAISMIINRFDKHDLIEELSNGKGDEE